VLGIFKIGSLKLFAQAGKSVILLISVSQEARIIDVSPGIKVIQNTIVDGIKIFFV
jgi:hypothetical protein